MGIPVLVRRHLYIETAQALYPIEFGFVLLWLYF